MTTATEYAEGLRQLAAWLDAHPDTPPPENTISCWSINTREEAAKVLTALAPCEKIYGDSLFYLKRTFGPITLRFVFNREEVCVKRVVGTKLIPAQEIPEHVEEIVEWDCIPLLKEAAND